MTTRLPIKQVLLHQSIKINQREESTLGTQAHVRAGSRVNYKLFWEGEQLFIEYENGEIDILPVGNIKKMSIDIDAMKKGTECKPQVQTKPAQRSSRSLRKNIPILRD